MALKDTDGRGPSGSNIARNELSSLMVGVAHPGYGGTCGEKHGNIGEKTKGDNRRVFDAAVFKHHYYFHDEPGNTGHSAAGVNSPKVLCMQSAKYSKNSRNDQTCKTEVQPRRNLRGVH